MRAPTPRLTAALTTIALGASLAGPGLEAASATPTVPSLPDVSAALTAAGISGANASTILGELGSLQGLAPGGSLPLLSLSALDNSLSTLNGGLLGSLLTPVLGLLTALNPAAPTPLAQTIADLGQIRSAAGATAAVQQAASELQAALTTAGLGQLLTQIPGLSALQNTSALSALAGLQSLPLAGNIPTGSLAPVATVLSTLAGAPGVSGTPAASTLSTAASTLNGSGTISPSALLGVIGQLQGLTSGTGALPAPMNGVASALAAQLGDSGTILGGLSSLGNPPSASTITTALTALTALPGLPAGATIPAGSLAPIAGILTTIAGEPGISSTPAATTLTSAAGQLGSALSPSVLAGLVTSLQGAGGSLPAPLGGLVTAISNALGASGTLAAITGTTSTTTTSQTGTTQTSTTSQASTTTQTGTTTQTATQAGATSQTGTTTQAGTTQSTATTHTGTSTQTVSTGSTTTTGSGGTHHVKSAAHGGSSRVQMIWRSGHSVTLRLTCSASRGRRCTATVLLSEPGYRTAHRMVTVPGTGQRTITVKLSASRGRTAGRSRRRPVIHVAVRSGGYRFTRALS